MLSLQVYVHRSGRTARALSDGCSIALISPKETSNFASLCRSFAKVFFGSFSCDDGDQWKTTINYHELRLIGRSAFRLCFYTSYV